MSRPLANQVLPSWCEDHRTPVLGECPFCLRGLPPTRVLEAQADFAGVPLDGTRDILPSQVVVSFEDVVRVLGLQLAELERLEAEAIRPYAEAKGVIYRQMRRASIDPRTMQKAVRLHLGQDGAAQAAGADSPAVMAIVGLLKEGVG